MCDVQCHFLVGICSSEIVTVGLLLQCLTHVRLYVQVLFLILFYLRYF